jgi:hypothetical protein
MRPDWDEVERRNRRNQERPQRLFAISVVRCLRGSGVDALRGLDLEGYAAVASGRGRIQQ